MKKNKLIIIIAIIAIVATIGYFGIKIANRTGQEVEEQKVVDVMTIKKEDNTVILNGVIESSNAETFYYDYATYGELWNTHVTTGQYVEKDQIIIESSKKDYKAPFNGYITQLNVDAAYNQAKEANDDDIAIENPQVLYTIASNDYYINSSITEYELSRLPENKSIEFEIRALGEGQKFAGDIRSISGQPVIEPGSDISAYQMMINMSDEGKNASKIGNHVTIRITDSNEQPIILPKSAIVESEGTLSVYLYEPTVGQSGIIKKQAVELEKQEDESYKLINGLVDGDQIIVNISPNIQDGDLVTVASNQEVDGQ